MDYLDGNLTPEQAKMVEDQINHNAKWKREYEQLTELDAAINNSKQLEPTLDLKENFIHFLQSEMADQDQNSSESEGGVIKMNPYRTWMQIAAGVLLLLVGAIVGSRWAKG